MITGITYETNVTNAEFIIEYVSDICWLPHDRVVVVELTPVSTVMTLTEYSRTVGKETRTLNIHVNGMTL